jgi:hypothetical protein
MEHITKAYLAKENFMERVLSRTRTGLSKMKQDKVKKASLTKNSILIAEISQRGNITVLENLRGVMGGLMKACTKEE